LNYDKIINKLQLPKVDYEQTKFYWYNMMLYNIYEFFYSFLYSYHFFIVGITDVIILIGPFIILLCI